MKVYFVWLLLIAGIISSTVSVQGEEQQGRVPPTGPKIKVLLEKDVASAFLEVKGPYKVVRKESGMLLSSGTKGKRFVTHALQDGLRWGEEYPDVYQISVIPLTPDSSLLVNGIQYKGAISVYHVRDNRVTLVNEVTIEDYLRSTLSLQYGEGELQKEALAAIAIGARTDAYSKVLQGGSLARPWDITAQEASYCGFGVTRQKGQVEEVVAWTRYMVLESLKEGLAQAYITPTQVGDLAARGLDAQKILTTLCPYTKIGSTIRADEVATLYR